MDNYESNCIILRAILGSCLSDIKKSLSLWHYIILLLEDEEYYSISFMLNLTISKLKQILEPCGLITIKDNNFKFIIHTSSHGDTYSWSMIRLENSLLDNNVNKKICY